ncbi:MAG: chromosome partitioning protein ParB [Porticoccaceae bacterium]|nr:chromosome partitioning protein ParB [Porticoccaceae bacterium]|tara:strand:+ start:33 stop:917 length:885 start_codon:yes stop_codon:yes gene_type:complete
MNKKRESLGKGLDALMSDFVSDEDFKEAITSDAQGSGHFNKELPLEYLERGQYQPRRNLDPSALTELSNSILRQGVMQPIIVREIATNRYEIIAGERRWRASQQAGLENIPAIIRQIDDQSAMAIALIENIQREDLNAIEESRALIRLQNEFDLTQQQIASNLGKSRSAVTNLMRLVKLEEFVQELVESGDLELGHAKCLLSLDGSLQIGAAQTVVRERLSVRKTEMLIKRLKKPERRVKSQISTNADILSLETKLSDQLGASVQIKHLRAGSGSLVIKYNSLEELEGILNHIR